MWTMMTKKILDMKTPEQRQANNKHNNKSIKQLNAI